MAERATARVAPTDIQMLFISNVVLANVEIGYCFDKIRKS